MADAQGPAPKRTWYLLRHRRRSTEPHLRGTAANAASAEARVPLEWHILEGEVLGYIFEKPSYLGAPLRNRTVDLLLTMYRCAVLPPQVERLNCVNTSTHWHSQAPDKPTRAPFSTQSATHFDLGDEPSYQVVNIQFDDRTVCAHGLSLRFTSASRLRSVCRAVRAWASHATQTVLDRVYADRITALALSSGPAEAHRTPPDLPGAASVAPASGSAEAASG
jgi:hypothetical protein